MHKKLLGLLNKNAKYSIPDLAAMLEISEDEVTNQIKQMENEGLIRGYKTVIDYYIDDYNDIIWYGLSASRSAIGDFTAWYPVYY